MGISALMNPFWSGVGRGVMVLSGILLAGSAFGQSLDFNLSKESAEATLTMAIPSGGFGRGQYDIGFLYRDSDDVNGYVVSLGAGVTGEAGTDAPGLEFMAGLRGYYSDVEDVTTGALTLGAGIRYAPPVLNRFYMQANINYAPKIVTFSDGEQFYYFAGRIGYEILPEAEIYLGYRDVAVGFERGPDFTVQEGGYLGLKILF